MSAYFQLVSISAGPSLICNPGRRRGVPRIYHWGQDRRAKAESGGGVLGEEAATSFPPDRGSGKRCEPHPTPTPPKGFPLFSALRMAAPDIMDYHAAIGGGQDPRAPLAYATGRRLVAGSSASTRHGSVRMTDQNSEVEGQRNRKVAY